MSFSSPPDAAGDNGSAIAKRGLPAALSACIALAILLISGLLAGELIRHVGVAGVVLLCFAGWFSGTAASKLSQPASPWVGVVLAAGCFASAILMETYWLRYQTVQGQEGWAASFALLPTLVQEAKTSVFIAAIATILAATTAWQASQRPVR